MTHVDNSVVRFMIRWRNVLLAMALLAAAIAYLPASQLQLDRSIETFFAESDPLIGPYQKLKRCFGGNDVVLGAYEDPHLFDTSLVGMKRLEKVAERLERVEGVDGVLSLNRLVVPSKIVNPRDRVGQDLRRLFEGFTHGADGTISAVACTLLPENQTTATRQETIDNLRAELNDLPDDMEPGIVTGEPVMIVDAFRYIEQDSQRLIYATTFLLGLMILLAFRSIRWVAIPILVVQFAILLTNGVLAASGIRLTMVSSMLSAVVTVIGVATVLHVVVHFREGREMGMTPVAALHRTGRLLAGPIMWACITDAVGFAALTIAEVTPVRDFGIMMAVGAFMVLLSSALLIPGLVLLGGRDNTPRFLWGEHLIDRQLKLFVSAAHDRPMWVCSTLLVMMIVAVMGITRLEIETDFTKNFRSDTSIATSYALVESRLGGAGVCDIVIAAPKVLNWTFLRKMIALESRLQEQVTVTDPDGTSRQALTKVLSLGDIVVSVAPGNLHAAGRFQRNLMVRLSLSIMQSRMPSFYKSMYGEDPSHPGNHYYRIMLRTKERQPAEDKLAIIQGVNQTCRASLEEDEYSVTGYFVLLTKLIDGVMRDQWRTFLLSLCAIGATMTYVLRSLRLALIALIPNVVPILLVNGMMGWMGLRVNMGAAMIAAVSIGISIDSSIHYLYAFRRSRLEGQSVRQSLESVQASVGRALVFSTVSLIAGFSTLASSQFIPTVYFGVLVSLTMIGGLFGNLLWLPMLIRLTEPETASAKPDKVPIAV